MVWMMTSSLLSLLVFYSFSAVDGFRIRSLQGISSSLGGNRSSGDTEDGKSNQIDGIGGNVLIRGGTDTDGMEASLDGDGNKGKCDVVAHTFDASADEPKEPNITYPCLDMNAACNSDWCNKREKCKWFCHWFESAAAWVQWATHTSVKIECPSPSEKKTTYACLDLNDACNSDACNNILLQNITYCKTFYCNRTHWTDFAFELQRATNFSVEIECPSPSEKKTEVQKAKEAKDKGSTNAGSNGKNGSSVCHFVVLLCAFVLAFSLQLTQ